MSSKTSTLHRILKLLMTIRYYRTVKLQLQKKNYDVRTANDGKSAIEVAKEFEPELIILISWCPNLMASNDGNWWEIEPLKSVLTYFTWPPRSEEYSEVAAFDVGQMIIPKPIKPRALISRINAFFRKCRSEPSTLIEIVDLQLTENTRLTRNRSLDGCPRKNWTTFYYLAQRPTRFAAVTNFFRKYGERMYSWLNARWMYTSGGKNWKWLHQNLERSYRFSEWRVNSVEFHC
jgi:two-component system alkaline phosphatase synthesis response regulator PhoP